MFTVTPNGPNRIDIEFSGKLDTDEMKRALDDFASKCEGIEHGRMLYRIDEFALPTLGAIALEFSRLPEMFRIIRRFERAAVLVDQAWVRKASEIEGALIPGLEIRAFERNQEAQAEAWLEG